MCVLCSLCLGIPNETLGQEHMLLEKECFYAKIKQQHICVIADSDQRTFVALKSSS